MTGVTKLLITGGAGYRRQFRSVLATPASNRPHRHDRRYATCADKLANELGFRATTPLAEGLRRTLDWYLNNEEWWRGIQSGAYRDWMKLQYGNVLSEPIA